MSEQDVDENESAILRLLRPYTTADQGTKPQQKDVGIDGSGFEAKPYVQGLVSKLGLSELKDKRNSLRREISDLRGKLETTVMDSFNKFDQMAATLPTFEKTLRGHLGLQMQVTDLFSNVTDKSGAIASLFSSHETELSQLISANEIIQRKRTILRVPEQLKTSLRTQPVTTFLSLLVDSVRVLFEGEVTDNTTNFVINECMELGRKAVLKAVKSTLSNDMSAEKIGKQGLSPSTAVEICHHLIQLGVDEKLVKDIVRAAFHSIVNRFAGVDDMQHRATSELKDKKRPSDSFPIAEVAAYVEETYKDASTLLRAFHVKPSTETVDVTNQFVFEATSRCAREVRDLSKSSRTAALRQIRSILTETSRLIDVILSPLQQLEDESEGASTDVKCKLFKDCEWPEITKILTPLHECQTTVDTQKMYLNGWRLFCSKVLSEYAQLDANNFKTMFIAEIRPSLTMWEKTRVDSERGYVVKLPFPPTEELRKFINQRLANIDMFLSPIMDMSSDNTYKEQCVCEAFDSAMDVLVNTISSTMEALSRTTTFSPLYFAKMLFSFAKDPCCSELSTVRERHGIVLDERAHHFQNGLLLAASGLMELGVSKITGLLLFRLEGKIMNGVQIHLNRLIRSAAIDTVLCLLRLREQFNVTESKPNLTYDGKSILCDEYIGHLPLTLGLIASETWTAPTDKVGRRAYIPPLNGEVFEERFTSSMIVHILASIASRFRLFMTRLPLSSLPVLEESLCFVVSYLSPFTDAKVLRYLADSLIIAFLCRTADPPQFRSQSELFATITSLDFLHNKKDS